MITREQSRLLSALRLAACCISANKRLAFVIVDKTSDSLLALLAVGAGDSEIALVDRTLSPQKMAALLESYRPEIVLAPGSLDATLSLAKYASWKAFRDERGAVHGAVDDGAVERAPIHPSLFLLLATSGTTGAPRFCRLSRVAVLANARQIVQALAIDNRSVGILHLPIHYSYGFRSRHRISPPAQASSCCDDAITSRSFWSNIARAGGAHFPGVPFHYTTLARLGFGLVPDCVTTFTQAGGALDLRSQRIMHQFAHSRGGRF